MALAELPARDPGDAGDAGDPGDPDALPRRAGAAPVGLAEVARRVAPVTSARERVVPVPGDLGALLPGGGLTRGTVVRVGGRGGAGVTTVVARLAAAVTQAGEWAAVVDLHDTFGGLAALDAGVVAERFALVRSVPRDCWSTVVAALLDGVTFLAATVPARLRAGDARRLVARARERGAVLAVVESAGVVSRRVGAWPADAALRLDVVAATWRGCTAGFLDEPRLHVEVTGKGAAHRPRGHALAG